MGIGRGAEDEADANEVSVLPRTRDAMERKRTGSVANIANAAKSMIASVTYVDDQLMTIRDCPTMTLTPTTGTLTSAKITNSSMARARKRIQLNIKVRMIRE
jgi:hypothetical protein